MGRRLQLQELLELTLGSSQVYFQPPANIKLAYPCIVYKRNLAETQYGDNSPYLYMKRYMVTVIDRDPDSEIPDRVAELPLCIFSTHYTSDGLNHDVFNLYF